MSDIIDINVGETIEEVTINVTDNLITVNINKITGGGGGAVSSVNGQDGVVVLNQDDIADGTTYKQYSLTEKNKLAGIASGAEVNVNADWNAVSGDAQILNKPTIPAAQVNSDWNATSGVSEILNKPTIPSTTTLVPYTGATSDVDLGAFSLNAKSMHVKGTAGNGHLGLKHQSSNATAGGQETSLFAGSDGELYYKNASNSVEQVASETYVNAKVADSITNGVTDIAPSQNAVFDALALKQNIVSGVNDTEIGYLDGVTSSIQTQLNARCQSLYNLTSEVTHTGTTAKTLLITYFIPANTFTNGDFLNFNAMVSKVANISNTTHTIEINTTNTLTGATVLLTIGFNTSNFSMKFKREFALNSGKGYYLNTASSTTSDQAINAVANVTSSFNYNLAADLYLFVTCQLTNATDSITYRGVSITKN